MKYCSECQLEFSDEIIFCPNCNANLILTDEDEQNKDSIFIEEDYELVYSCSDMLVAEMIKTNLESAGITTYVLSQFDKNFPVIGDFSIIKILVEKENSEFAKEFIESLSAAKDSKTEEDGNDL